jgi:hypothetical protein
MIHLKPRVGFDSEATQLENFGINSMHACTSLKFDNVKRAENNYSVTNQRQ